MTCKYFGRLANSFFMSTSLELFHYKTYFQYTSCLRVDLETEKVGLDIMEHGGAGFERCISHYQLTSYQQAQPNEDNEGHTCCAHQSEIENETDCIVESQLQ